MLHCFILSLTPVKCARQVTALPPPTSTPSPHSWEARCPPKWTPPASPWRADPKRVASPRISRGHLVPGRTTTSGRTSRRGRPPDIPCWAAATCPEVTMSCCVCVCMSPWYPIVVITYYPCFTPPSQVYPLISNLSHRFHHEARTWSVLSRECSSEQVKAALILPRYSSLRVHHTSHRWSRLGIEFPAIDLLKMDRFSFIRLYHWAGFDFHTVWLILAWYLEDMNSYQKTMGR